MELASVIDSSVGCWMIGITDDSDVIGGDNKPEPGSIPFLQFNSNSNSDTIQFQLNSESGTKSLRQFNSNSNSDDGNSNLIPSPMLSIPLNSVIHIDRTKLNLH